MSFPFKSADVLYILLLAFYVFFTILQWSEYSDCSAPIQIFLISSRSILLFLVIFLIILKNPTLSQRAKSFLNFSLYIVLNPLCAYLAVQGTIWQIKNMTNTPDCLIYPGQNIAVWAWITGVACLAGLLSYANVIRAYSYWKVFQFRRRWMRLSESGNPEEINDFLYGTEDLNSKTGLAVEDIEKLQKNEFCSQGESVQSIIKGNVSDTCAICFEDYKTGDCLTSLPKCEHRFHGNCIKGWLVKSHLCPMCRGNVRSNLCLEKIEQV